MISNAFPDAAARHNDIPAPSYSAPLVPAHRDPRIVDASILALSRLRMRFPSCTTALILTDDGFEVARESHTDASGNRLASMSSSMQALTEALARELHVGVTRYTFLDAEDGIVLIMRVPQQRLVLVAVFDHFDTTGRVLLLARHIVTDFAAEVAANTTEITHKTSKDEK